MATTSLERFVAQVTTRFKEATETAYRLPYAQEIAKRYRFECPEIVFFYTHPEVAKLPLRQRCERVGITEEQFHLLASQPGFKKFVTEWQAGTQTSLYQQATDKIADAIVQDRVRYDKNGNETEDFTIELELVKQNAIKQAPAPQVNIQVNNLWDRARARLREESAS